MSKKQTLRARIKETRACAYIYNTQNYDTHIIYNIEWQKNIVVVYILYFIA